MSSRPRSCSLNCLRKWRSGSPASLLVSWGLESDVPACLPLPPRRPATPLPARREPVSATASGVLPSSSLLAPAVRWTQNRCPSPSCDSSPASSCLSVSLCLRFSLNSQAHKAFLVLPFEKFLCNSQRKKTIIPRSFSSWFSQEPNGQLNSASQQLPQASASHRILHRLDLRLSLCVSVSVFFRLPRSSFFLRLRSSFFFFFFFFGRRILQRLCLHLLKRKFPESKLK